MPISESAAAPYLAPLDAAQGAGAPTGGIVTLVVGLALASLAMVCVFQGVQQILLPAQVQQIDPRHKIGQLALLTTLAAALAVAGSVAGGALSDRTRSRFGRRSPWLVAMSLAAGALLIVTGTARGIAEIAMLYAAAWFCLNFYQAALSAIIPDRVPERSRGAVSSAVGLGAALGLGLGVSAVAALTPEQGYMALAALIVAATVACVILVGEWRGAAPPEAASASPAASANGRPAWFDLFKGFASTDFTLAFATRAMSYLALGSSLGFIFYILQDHIGAAKLPGHNVKGAIAFLTVLQMVCWIIGAAGAGWLADRLDRRKLFVGVSSLGMAAAMLAPLVSPTWPGMIAFSAIIGLSFGVYLGVDLALMTLVLPSRENEGRDLAVLSIANAGPQLLSPAISAAIISTAGYPALFLFGFAVSLLAGVAVFFIRSVR